MTTVKNNFQCEDFALEFNAKLKDRIEQMVLERLKNIPFRKIEIADDNNYKKNKVNKHLQPVVLKIWPTDVYVHPDDLESTINFYNDEPPYPIFTPIHLPVDTDIEHVLSYREELVPYYKTIINRFENIYLIKDYLSVLVIGFDYNVRGLIASFLSQDKEYFQASPSVDSLPDNTTTNYSSASITYRRIALRTKFKDTLIRESRTLTEEQVTLVKKYIADNGMGEHELMQYEHKSFFIGIKDYNINQPSETELKLSKFLIDNHIRFVNEPGDDYFKIRAEELLDTITAITSINNAEALENISKRTAYFKAIEFLCERQSVGILAIDNDSICAGESFVDDFFDSI